MELFTDYQNRIDIRFLNSDFLKDIQKAAFNTVGKHLVNNKELSPLVFKKYLISEHSPIRTAIIETLFIDISYPTSVHFARHVHSIPFVTTSREDRTGKKRNLETPVNHLAIWNIQSLIDMMRKRLCIGCCAADTYNWAKSLKLKLLNSGNKYFVVLGEVLVPNCIYRCGCPEFKKCDVYKKVLSRLNFTDLYSIDKRYDHYNKFLISSD